MFKKLILLSLAVLIALSPFAPTAQADDGSWTIVQANAAWNYGDYRVERLSFDRGSVGPVSLGDHVIIAEPAASCSLSGCDRVNAYVLKNGRKMPLGNVPAYVLDEQRYFANGHELVFVDTVGEDENRWNIVTVNLDTGERTVLAEDFFLDGVEEMTVYNDSGTYYLNPSLNFNNHKGFTQATVYVYDPGSRKAKIVSDHYITNRDEVQDVQDGVVVSRMRFESGYSQLWTYDNNPAPATMKAVSDTWTSPDEEIIGAHFRDDGSIEFFRMYERFVYDGEQTVSQGDYLSWFRSPEEAIQIAGGRMAWLDAEDTLRVSSADGVRVFGTLGFPSIFKLEEGRLFYSSGDEGRMYDFATGLETVLPFAVSDSFGDILVGQNADGSAVYMNLVTGKVLELGYGSEPVVSDRNHVYWKGSDNNIYEATISLSAQTDVSEARALSVAYDSTVYLLQEGRIYEIPNETVYFTWFDSWDDVESATSTEVFAYQYSGVASFAPGTRLKLYDDPKVYTVGTDGKLHWLMTETIAYAVYGSTWNRGIIDITERDLTGLMLGSTIQSEADAQSI